MNNQYLLYREKIRAYVENQLFKPIAKANGFVEKDKYGHEVLLYPKLTFTRLAIRDNQDYYDNVFNLYQKGSVSVDLILDLLNIDPADANKKLKRDLGTLNDATMNEALRSAYSEVGQRLVAETDFMDRIVKNLGLKQQSEDFGMGEDEMGGGAPAPGGAPPLPGGDLGDFTPDEEPIPEGGGGEII